MTSSALIACSNVTKTFPSVYGLSAWIRHRGRPPRRTALDDVSLQIQAGALFGLLGPNGAGKTTMLKLMATLSLPDRGTIVVNGSDATTAPDAVKRQIGLCTAEERSFYYRLTARENLEFFGALSGLRGSHRAARIADVSELVDLRQALDRRFDTFSSGMRVRLALARALLADPPILLLDEPTRGVDPVHADAIRRLMRDELVQRRHKTIVLTTNLLEEARAVCDDIAILNAGRIIAQGAPADLNAKIGGRVRYVITFDHLERALVERLSALQGVLAAQGGGEQGDILSIDLVAGGPALSRVLNAATQNGSTVLSVRPLDDGLLDFFRTKDVPT